MGDLKDRRLIIGKGLLFLVTGAMAAGLLLIENWSWRNAVELTICVWCFCRFYYFAFYVIEKYVDHRFRFAGLSSFVLYLLRGPRPENEPEEVRSASSSANDQRS